MVRQKTKRFLGLRVTLPARGLERHWGQIIIAFIGTIFTYKTQGVGLVGKTKLTFTWNLGVFSFKLPLVNAVS